MPESLFRRKEGQVSVLIAAFVALAMFMLAFGIDIAHVLVQKRHAQNAADAAALAAARWLPLDGSGCNANNWDIPGTCAYNISQTARFGKGHAFRSGKDDIQRASSFRAFSELV